MKAHIFNTYVGVICDTFQISKKELFRKTKARANVTARQSLYYICFERPMRVVEIQTMMRKNGLEVPHTTILHGINAMRKRMTLDKDYQSIINQIQTTHGASQEEERV